MVTVFDVLAAGGEEWEAAAAEDFRHWLLQTPSWLEEVLFSLMNHARACLPVETFGRLAESSRDIFLI